MRVNNLLICEGMFGYINLALLGHFYRSVRIKWAVMYLCVRDINVSSFYDFDIWFLDSADSVFFIFILFRYDVLLINISNCANCISLIYHKKNWDKKDSASASFLEIYLIVDNNGQISTRLRDKETTLILEIYIFNKSIVIFQ